MLGFQADGNAAFRFTARIQKAPRRSRRRGALFAQEASFYRDCFSVTSPLTVLKVSSRSPLLPM